MTTAVRHQHRTSTWLLLAAIAVVAMLAVVVQLASDTWADTADDTPAPDWLRAAAMRVFASCGESQPESAWWTIATEEQYRAALGDTDPVDDRKSVELYVVVAHGEFGWYGSQPTPVDGPSTGRTLVIRFDPATHGMATLDLLIDDTPVETTLGASSEL